MHYNKGMIILSNIADIRTGYNPRSTAKSEQQTVFAISAKDFATDYTETSKENIPKSFNNYLRDGDILVKSRGVNYEAKIFRPHSREHPYIAVNTLIMVRLKTNHYKPAYITQIINSESAQQFLRSLSSGAVLSTLSPSSLGSLSCPRISLREQEKLENITKTIDEYQVCMTQYQKASEKLVKAVNQQVMKGVEPCN